MSAASANAMMSMTVGRGAIMEEPYEDPWCGVVSAELLRDVDGDVARMSVSVFLDPPGVESGFGCTDGNEDGMGGCMEL